LFIKLIEEVKNIKNQRKLKKIKDISRKLRQSVPTLAEFDFI